MPVITSVLAIGTLAARPAASASNTGFLYCASDLNGGTLFQSNGASWVQIAAAVTQGAASAWTWATKTTAYTIQTTDTGILVDTSGGAVTITLPTAVGSTRNYAIKKKTSDSNAVTVATTSSQLIDGASTYTLSTQNQAIELASDNVNWYVH